MEAKLPASRCPYPDPTVPCLTPAQTYSAGSPRPQVIWRKKSLKLSSNRFILPFTYLWKERHKNTKLISGFPQINALPLSCLVAPGSALATIGFNLLVIIALSFPPYILHLSFPDHRPKFPQSFPGLYPFLAPTRFQLYPWTTIRCPLYPGSCYTPTQSPKPFPDSPYSTPTLHFTNSFSLTYSLLAPTLK